MLKQISWADYLSAIAALLAVYYFIMILLFYRDDIRQVLTGKRNFLARREATRPDSDS